MAEQQGKSSSNKVDEYIDEECSPRPLAGGYDDSLFIETPPVALTCPVCLLVLKQPHLLSCCGAHICHICIDHIKSASKPCPCCRDNDYSTLLNKNMRGNVYSLKVRCSNQDCRWTGELGGLERHKADLCQYTIAECRYGCGVKYPRHVLGIHERDKCSNCPMEDRIEGLNQRLDEEMTAIEKKYDVDISGLKKTLQEQSVIIETMKADHNKETELLKKELKRVNTEIENIKKTIEDNKQQHGGPMITTPTGPNNPPPVLAPTWHTPTPQTSDITIPPCVMIMDRYSIHKANNEVWSSPPFHSAKDGYKFCLTLHANGDNTGKNTHLSLYVVLMKGSNDAVLKWPFKGEFVIQLVNWREDSNHVTSVIKFDEYTPKEWSRRLYDVDRAVNGRGKHRLVVHSFLSYNSAKNTEYLDQDRLCLKVVKVTMY